jgi:uncharacterized protein (DUF697 family)
VLTCLHDAYPGKQHPEPDPFLSESKESTVPASLPDDLGRSLKAQFERWAGLFDRVVAIDLTPADDGFDQPEFGGLRLKQAILDLLPAAYRHTFFEMDKLSGQFSKMHQRRATQMILAHSAIAASAAAVPVPWIDIPFVLAIQSYLAYRLASLNGQSADATTLAHVTGALGGQTALRMGLREALKFVPWVGIAANAAAVFAFTYASGWAWNWYFMQTKGGQIPTDAELRHVYREQLQRGATLWRTTHAETNS